MGILYYDLFRTFDVMIITPKPYKKQCYGSIQRITLAMKSWVPVLVEAKGPVFEAFVDRYNYPCVYADSGGKYPTLREALVSMQNVTMRIKCQNEGLHIAEDFSPEFLIKKLLHTMGYEGSYECWAFSASIICIEKGKQKSWAFCVGKELNEESLDLQGSKICKNLYIWQSNRLGQHSYHTPLRILWSACNRAFDVFLCNQIFLS